MSTNKHAYQIEDTAELDQRAVDVVVEAKRLNGYASTAEQARLQTCVTALSRSVDAHLKRAKDEGEGGGGLSDVDRLFEMVDSLIAAASRLAIRPVAFPSAVFVLGTIQKLLILLTSIELPTIMDAKKMDAKKDQW